MRFASNSELFGDGALITPAIFLKPEIANNSNIGLVLDKTDKGDHRLQIEANAFYMNVQQLIQPAVNGLSVSYVNYAKARIAGADIDIKYDLTNTFYGSINATLQKPTDRKRYTPDT